MTVTLERPSTPTDDGVATSDRFSARLALLTVLGLVVRVAYAWFRRDARVWGDAYFYHEAARVLADGNGFVNPYYLKFANISEQSADHPPLYLLYLTGFTALGLGTTFQHLLVSVPLGALTIVVVGLTGRKVGGDRVGLLAAGLAALYPNVWSHDGMLMSETMAILTVSTVLLCAYRYREVPSLQRAAVLGAAAGLASLSRSETSLLTVLIVLPLVLGPDRSQWLRRVPRLMMAGGACLLTVLPWVAFNLSRFDRPVYLSAGFEVTLSSASCDHTYYGSDTGYWSMQCPLEQLDQAHLAPGVSGADQTARSAVFYNSSIDYIRNHLRRLPVVILARWGRITGLYQPVQQVNFDSFPEGRDLTVAATSMAAFYVLAGLAILGVRDLRRRRQPVYVLIAPLLTVLVTVTITFATTRYRATAETALCLLAAVGIDALWRLRSRLAADDGLAGADAALSAGDGATGPGGPTS